MGTLFIVATPIGNLRDISLRAIEAVTQVPVIVSEDTRRTGILLQSIRSMVPQSYLLQKPQLISYYEQNELQRIPAIIDILKTGNDVALVSDAGTPTISDPGFKLVRECIKQGIKIESIPGPSSATSALVSSGLPTDKFLFLGFLPKKKGHRKTLLENVKKANEFVKSTIILFEAPHRLVKTLEELQETYGDVAIVISRELTKVHEEIRREKISESIAHFSKVNPKGEFVLLLHRFD